MAVWKSSVPDGTKVVWTVLILLLPILGAIAWFFFGPKPSGW
jgi:hypothetical protein